PASLSLEHRLGGHPQHIAERLDPDHHINTQAWSQSLVCLVESDSTVEGTVPRASGRPAEKADVAFEFAPRYRFGTDNGTLPGDKECPIGFGDLRAHLPSAQIRNLRDHLTGTRRVTQLKCRDLHAVKEHVQPVGVLGELH